MSIINAHQRWCFLFLSMLAAGMSAPTLFGQTTVATTYNFDSDSELGSTSGVVLVEQLYMINGTPVRRVYFRINRIDSPSLTDLQARTGKVALPELNANRDTGRAYRPEIFANQRFRIRDFTIDFDHLIVGDVFFDAISAQEQFTVLPYYLVADGDRVRPVFFTDRDFSFSTTNDPRGGTGNRKRLNCKLTLNRPADGIFFNVTDGPSNGSGGPENFDNLTVSLIAGDVDLVSSFVNSSTRSIAARLTTAPSIRNGANRAARSPSEADPAQYRRVTLKLSSRRNLVLFNGQPTATMVFDVLNYSRFQTLRLTTVDDGNNVVGQGGQDIIDVVMDTQDGRHDDFFSGFQRAVTVEIPDNDVAPPRLLSVQVDNGIQRSNVTFVQVLFDRAVTFDPTAFDLRNSDSGASVALSPQSENVAGGFQVTFRFQGSQVRGPGALVDGNYQFSVDGSKIRDSQGLKVGSSSMQSFHTLFGDVADSTGNPRPDQRVTREDFSVFRDVLRGGSYDARLDFDGDGAVTGADFGQARRNFTP